MIKTLRNEKDIQSFLKKYEKKARRDFEKNLPLHMKSLESVLKGEIPTNNSKNRQLILSLTDTNVPAAPIYYQAFDIDENFNAVEFSHLLYEKVKNFYNSKEFLTLQKKWYCRLREKGFEPSEIYPQIEPSWDKMSSKEKKAVRDRLSKGYSRKLAKKHADKTG